MDQPPLLIRLVDEGATHRTEGKAQARRQRAQLLLTKHIAYTGRITGEHHTVHHGVLHVHTAQHHQEAATILGHVDQCALHLGGTRVDGQLQVCRIPIEDLDLRIVDWLELDGIELAIRPTSHDVQLLREHIMLHCDSTVRAQLNLLLHLHLFLLLLLLLVALVPLVRPAIGLELLVDLLQILVLVVEREQVEATLPVDLSLVLDDVTGLQLRAGYVRSLVPVIGGIIGQRAIRPVKHRDV